MSVIIIIPWIRPEKIKTAMRAADQNAGCEVTVYPKEDKDRIGCPVMVAQMVAETNSTYVAFLGDDSLAAPNYIKNALEEMREFPDGIGLIGFNDKTGRTLPTHWIAHRGLLPMIGNEFFHTGYHHTMCDVELMERAKELGRYHYSQTAFVLHDHPLFSDAEQDADYQRVYSPEIHGADLELFNRRKENGWK
jgi:hypothetical protein